MAKTRESTQNTDHADGQKKQDDSAQREKQPLKELNKDDETPKTTDDA